jgi:hypothetical protein
MTAWDGWKRDFFSIFLSYEVFLYGVWDGESNSFRSSAPSTLRDVTSVRLALNFCLVSTELGGWIRFMIC